MNHLASWAVPSTFVLGALAAPRRAAFASGAALALALLFAVAALRTGSDPAAPIVLLLVCTLGFVIVRFSRTYLHGDVGLHRYLRWLLSTLGAVAALVVANDLLVMALAWTATSLTLHQLLTFHGDRPAALLAAHKKFLVSRLADACLVVTLVLVHANVGTFDIQRIAAWADAHPALTPSMEIAAVFLVCAVALRSAQLPFHGWITQVMEAPTPVSALLHAGVVNIGGFVLIRLAPWIAHAAHAQLLLVVVGLASTTAAALVMTTRVSVKATLAWSTCAQMGFMLVECGLGLWPFALLHLVAHSLYKAHAFLRAGSTVDAWRIGAAAARRPRISALRLGLTTAFTVGSMVVAVIALPHGPSDVAVAVLLGLSLVPLLATPTSPRAFVSAAARALGVAGLYVALHALAELALPARVDASSAIAWGLSAIAFIALFAAKSALRLRPDGRLARALHPWLLSGLYLDEVFTRITFRLWPPRLPYVARSSARVVRAPVTSEAQA